MEQQPSVYTVEQIAKIMQVSEDTVRSWLKRKQNRLPSYRVGREFRISKTDFDAFLKRQQYGDDDDEWTSLSAILRAFGDRRFRMLPEAVCTICGQNNDYRKYNYAPRNPGL